MHKYASLSDLQAQFISILHADELKTKTHESLFKANRSDSVALKTRLGIYHHAYFARIKESLAEDFPKLKQKLGAQGFSKMVRKYLQHYPSRYPRLEQVGQNLPEFLSKCAPYTKQSELSELAQMEWARCLCTWSESDTPSDFSKLLGLTEEERLKQILVLASNAQFVRGSRACVFFKVLHEVKNLELTPSMEKLLGEIRAGRTLGELTALIENSAELTADAMSWISHWVSVGLLASFHAADT
jgi:hypothetical protein